MMDGKMLARSAAVVFVTLPATDPVRLIVPMLERFIATDRGFAKARRAVR